MPSSRSKSSKPISGYIRSNLETNGFVCLLVTLVMTAVAFLCSHNSWYASAQDDVSLMESASLNLGRVLFIVGFAFAAYQFRPFLIKMERDVILALPIKQTDLVLSGVITGLVTIFVSGVLSLLVFYPAMNLAVFTSGAVYLDCVSTAFCNIILPLCVYFLFSAIVILKTRDFISSAIWAVVLAICCFAVTSWIKTNSGMDAIGVYQTELFQSEQPFYYDAGLYLPTIALSVLLRAILPVGVSLVSAEALGVILNLLLCAGLFAMLYRAAGKAYLGEMDRPFRPRTLRYALPIAVLLCAGCGFAASSASFGSGFIIAVAVGGLLVVVTLFSNTPREIAIRITACLLVMLMPASAMITSGFLSRKATYDVPSPALVKAVYFNAVEPRSAAQWGVASQLRAADLAETCAKTRYRFTSDEAISAVVDLHQAIVDNIKKNKLVGDEEGIKVKSIAVASEDKLQFAYDAYLNKYGESLDVDMGYSVDIEVKNNPPVSGPVEQVQLDNNYIATFYYEMYDGRVFQRLYTPLPLSWIEKPMRKVLQTEEYANKQMKSLLDLSETTVNDYSSFLTVYDGMAKDFDSGKQLDIEDKEKLLDICRAIISDESKLTDNEILNDEIVYTLSFDMGNLINAHSDYLYIRSRYSKTIELVESLVGGGE